MNKLKYANQKIYPAKFNFFSAIVAIFLCQKGKVSRSDSSILHERIIHVIHNKFKSNRSFSRCNN